MGARTQDDVKRGFQKALLVHAGLLSVLFIHDIVSQLNHDSAKDKAREAALRMTKSAIRVDLVDLPRLKLEDMKAIDLTQEVGTPPPPAAEETAPEPKSASPSETAMKFNDGKKEAVKLFEKKESATDRMKSIRERLRADARRKEIISKLEPADGKKATGKAGNRPELAGNIKSAGFALTGELATESNAYNGKIRAHVQRHWNVPDWLLTGKHHAQVILHIGPDGKVLKKSFFKRSDNEQFNDSVMQAIDAADPLPAPPKELQPLYTEEGIVWGFPN